MCGPGTTDSINLWAVYWWAVHTDRPDWRWHIVEYLFHICVCGIVGCPVGEGTASGREHSLALQTVGSVKLQWGWFWCSWCACMILKVQHTNRRIATTAESHFRSMATSCLSRCYGYWDGEKGVRAQMHNAVKTWFIIRQPRTLTQRVKIRTTKMGAGYQEVSHDTHMKGSKQDMKLRRHKRHNDELRHFWYATTLLVCYDTSDMLRHFWYATTLLVCYDTYDY